MKLLKQHNIGKQWGMFTHTAGQLAMFVSAINLFLIAITAYNTTLSSWFVGWGIRVQLWMFLAVVVVLLLITFVVLYKFALPSYYSVFNEQFYRHDNLLRKDIEILKGTNKTILEKLEALEASKKK